MSIRLETVALTTDARTPRRVRNRLTEVLRDWGLPDLADDARYIADELVTNAILHGAFPARFWMYIHDDVLTLEVTDSSLVLPVPRAADLDDEDGRGFTIVAALATTWGVEPQRGGKRVWAELALPAAMAGAVRPYPGVCVDGDPPTVVLERVAA